MEEQDVEATVRLKSRLCGRCTRRKAARGSAYLPRPGTSEATYYEWKKKYVGLVLSELRELRQLREENAKLKRDHWQVVAYPRW